MSFAPDSIVFHLLLVGLFCGQNPQAPQSAKDADPSSSDAPQAYVQTIPGTEVSFKMVPIPGGQFQMGSPDAEEGHHKSEAPVHEVQISPFWIEVHELTWDEYHLFMKRPEMSPSGTMEGLEGADAVSRPTPPYVPMDFGMGIKKRPAVCMTQFAAMQYTKWLSASTGHFYRLPTEAEWEYACRAGTTTAYSWGDDPDDAEEYAWSYDNADDGYCEIMTKKPNPWGLYDMHGNVSEWVLDEYTKSGYPDVVTGPKTVDPVQWPSALYPRVVRGGSWDDDIDALRSATRGRSRKGWKVQDPQLPKSIWYHTDAKFVGFRVVRPMVEPSEEAKLKYWETNLESIREIQDRQRNGER